MDKRGPITVTHPVALRRFVTVGEVARRAIQAATVGGADEVLVRDPLRLDLQILARTIPAVFLRRGISAEGSATMTEFPGGACER